MKIKVPRENIQLLLEMYTADVSFSFLVSLSLAIQLGTACVWVRAYFCVPLPYMVADICNKRAADVK